MPDRPRDAPPHESAAAKKLRGALMVFVFGMIPVIGILIFLNLTKEQDPDQVGQDAAEQPSAETQPDVPTSVAGTSSLPKVTFVDVTAQTGVSFESSPGSTSGASDQPSPQRPSPDDLRGGVGVFDYDNDGNQDVLLVGAACRLFRGDGTMKFTDVTEQLGLDSALDAMGVAIGDYDGDGDRDLYVTADGRNRLLRNDRDKFTDVTESAGCGGSQQTCSTGASFIDYDNDGRLDLLVCHHDGDESGSATTLYQNQGEGRFDDVTSGAGLVLPGDESRSVRAIGVSVLDFNRDGFQDFCVTQLSGPNQLWENQRDGSFTEAARRTGLTIDQRSEGALGIDSSIYREDGTIAIVIGNDQNQSDSLFLAPPRRTAFIDAAQYNGLGPTTRSPATFSALFFDVDLDGRLDILTTHGGFEPSSKPFTPQLFWNAGRDAEREFVPLEDLGSSFEQPIHGRGAGFGDFDSDGDQDFVIVSKDGTAKIFRNDQVTGHHYLRIRLNGTPPTADAIGAQVSVTADGKTQTRVVHSARGYLSQSEVELTFGLGVASKVDHIAVRWPNGESQSVTPSAIDRQIDVRQQ